MYRRGGDESALVCWSDAGYGGEGTRAQSGTLIAWGGGTIVWRSSRQHSSALSTCEAEVAAAALSYQIVEGLRCLLTEWQIKLSTPILLIDSKSALTVAESGGTWRTRYFAVRAARLGEEHSRKNVVLRYTKTDHMAADALAKMSSSTLLDAIRACMAGNLPATPDATHNVKDDEQTGWAAQVLRSPLQRTQPSSSTSPASPVAVEAPLGALAAFSGAEAATTATLTTPAVGKGTGGALAASPVAEPAVLRPAFVEGAGGEAR